MHIVTLSGKLILYRRGGPRARPRRQSLVTIHDVELVLAYDLHLTLILLTLVVRDGLVLETAASLT